MASNAALLPATAAVFLLMFVRITTMLLLVPGFSSRSVPTPVKILFGLALTVVLIPFVPTADDAFSAPGRFVAAVAQEFLVGLLLGFGVAIVFGAIEMAANVIALQMGLNLAPVFNPSLNSQVIPFATFYLVLASLIFFTVNGHHIVLVALQRSFLTLPVGTASLSADADQTVIALTASMFVDALRIALPVAGTLLIADIALGFLNRMVPQMNVFFVGLPLKVFAGFALLLLTMPFLLRLFLSLTTDGVVESISRAGAVVR